MTPAPGTRLGACAMSVALGTAGMRGAHRARPRLGLFALAVLAAAGLSCRAGSVQSPLHALVLVSADAEWRVVQARYPEAKPRPTPWGEFFERDVTVKGAPRRVVFFHGGWGKVAAAGSTQYAIDRWHPRYILNLGTCGGFEGDIERFEILLVDKTIIYDIEEAMGDSAEAIDAYTTALDLSWLGPGDAAGTRRSLLVSADRDLRPADLPLLRERYRAVAGDWETGAIAHTCARNRQRLLILRGVSDLVGRRGGDAYGNEPAFVHGTEVVMNRLLDALPAWLDRCP